MLNWIKDPSMHYDMVKNEFGYDKLALEVSVQSPQPLSKGVCMSHVQLKYYIFHPLYTLTLVMLNKLRCQAHL